MIEYDIVSVVREYLAARLNGILQNFVHARDVCTHGDDCRKILKCRLHRVVKAGGDQQKHKKR